MGLANDPEPPNNDGHDRAVQGGELGSRPSDSSWPSGCRYQCLRRRSRPVAHRRGQSLYGVKVRKCRDGTGTGNRIGRNHERCRGHADSQGSRLPARPGRPPSPARDTSNVYLHFLTGHGRRACAQALDWSPAPRLGSPPAPYRACKVSHPRDVSARRSAVRWECRASCIPIRSRRPQGSLVARFSPVMRLATEGPAGRPGTAAYVLGRSRAHRLRSLAGGCAQCLDCRPAQSGRRGALHSLPLRSAHGTPTHSDGHHRRASLRPRRRAARCHADTSL